MWEIWAAGNNAWGQLDWGHPDRTATIQGRHGNPEATDYWTFRPVLGRARLEALTLRAGEFRTHGMSRLIASLIFFSALLGCGCEMVGSGREEEKPSVI